MANALINGYCVLLEGAPLIMKDEVCFFTAMSTIPPWMQNAHLTSCDSMFMSVIIPIVPLDILCFGIVQEHGSGAYL